MAAIGGIGLLMEYKLVSGEERWERYGSNPDLYMWGWDRHQWGDLHLILGYLFFGLLFFHIFLHWSQIKGIYQVMIKSKSRQVVLVSVFAITSLFLLFFAFLSPIDVVPLKEGEGRHRLEASRPVGEGGSVIRGLSEAASGEQPMASGSTEAGGELHAPLQSNQADLHEDVAIHEGHESRNLEIYGTSTIGEVAAKYNVPAELIKNALGIPVDRPDNERLGRLRRQYGFHMSDVERFIEEYNQKNK